MRKKLIKSLIIISVLCTIISVFVGCSKKANVIFDVAESYNTEQGTLFTFPISKATQENSTKLTTISLKDPDGKDVMVFGGQFFVEKSGNYTVIFSAFGESVERNLMAKATNNAEIWIQDVKNKSVQGGEFCLFDSSVIKVTEGSEISYSLKDNSGNDVDYNVYEDAVIFFAENDAVYTLEATATKGTSVAKDYITFNAINRSENIIADFEKDSDFNKFASASNEYGVDLSLVNTFAHSGQYSIRMNCSGGQLFPRMMMKPDNIYINPNDMYALSFWFYCDNPNNEKIGLNYITINGWHYIYDTGKIPVDQWTKVEVYIPGYEVYDFGVYMHSWIDDGNVAIPSSVSTYLDDFSLQPIDKMSKYYIKGASVYEVSCDGDNATTTEFNIANIKTSLDTFVPGIVKKVGEGEPTFADENKTKLLVKNGENYIFDNGFGKVIIRGTNKELGQVFAPGVDGYKAIDEESELVTIIGDLVTYNYKNGSESALINVGGDNAGPATFTIQFNSDGLISNENARSLVFKVNAYGGGGANVLKLKAIDLTGTYTFEEQTYQHPAVWERQDVTFVVYLPAGMNLSDLKLEFNRNAWLNVRLDGFRIIENTVENEINVANFDYASDFDSIGNNGFTDITEGKLHKHYDTAVTTTKIRVPILCMPNGINYSTLSLSLDASTPNIVGGASYDKTYNWKVSNGATEYTFNGNNDESTYVFKNVRQNSMITFECLLEGNLDNWGTVDVDNIKLILLQPCEEHLIFEYIDVGDSHEKYCADCGTYIETSEHHIDYREQYHDYACVCGKTQSNISGATIKEVACPESGTTNFDLTTIKNINGVFPSNYTVLDSNNSVVSVSNNILQVANGERYTFASIDGNVIIRGTNKEVGQIFAPGVDGYKGASEDAELITITDGHKITYNCLNEGVYSLIEIDGNNSSAKTSTIQFNTDGLISNENARSLVIKVSAYSGASANTLKIKAIDLTGTYSFAEQTYQSPAWDHTNFTFVVYLPAGMNLSDLKLEFNRGSWFNVRLDGFRIIENTVENEINVANFDYASDYHTVAQEQFSETNIDDGGNVFNNGKLNQSWATVSTTAIIKVPYLIMPEGMSYDSLNLSLVASTSNYDRSYTVTDGTTDYTFTDTDGEMTYLFYNVEHNLKIIFTESKDGYGTLFVDNIKFVLINNN